MSEHLTATRAGERFGVAIAAATDCHQACVEAMSYGLQRRGESAHLLHARLMLDCAEMCDTTRDMMLRSSDFAHQVAGALRRRVRALRRARASGVGAGHGGVCQGVPPLRRGLPRRHVSAAAPAAGVCRRARV